MEGRLLQVGEALRQVPGRQGPRNSDEARVNPAGGWPVFPLEEARPARHAAAPVVKWAEVARYRTDLVKFAFAASPRLLHLLLLTPCLAHRLGG
eukprot:CAMPEP_0185789978 /NCGR_PEP_ID=MMETSP1174-20130828/153842_1 /TAXON_ID=35687 /ORGANISM="Dictyocha speculum, Strain CCMP1381" /LENGTH=93 /DNA_ID=CAMNT_0028484391 /DNA_START=1 /DNA_END=279 /DNA_ORIENTATION=+